jgi:mannose-6-phosphate isomerase-like protein (cupin superfamily)
VRDGKSLTVDVFFFVFEGSGTVGIGDEQKSVGKDCIVGSPARIPHRWINNGSADLRILVVKVPGPTEETKLL